MCSHTTDIQPSGFVSLEAEKEKNHIESVLFVKLTFPHHSLSLWASQSGHDVTSSVLRPSFGPLSGSVSFFKSEFNRNKNVQETDFKTV